MTEHNVVIIGGGISGLSTAYYLQKKGVAFTLLERKKISGGILRTETMEGYMVDKGANTLVMDETIREMIQDLGLQEEVLVSNAKARYIYKEGKLHSLGGSPLSLVGTALLSVSAKWRILKEAISKNTEWDDNLSVGEFFEKRYSIEIFKTIIEPALTGIFGPTVREMSVSHTIPQLGEWIKKEGSILRGLSKSMKQSKKQGGRAIFSFKKGNASLIQALEDRLGDSLTHDAVVNSIETNDKTGHTIHYQTKGQTHKIKAKHVICTLPAHKARDIILDSKATKALSSIYYPPFLQIFVGYKKDIFSEFKKATFGFLVPRGQGKHLLGALFTSSIFARRTPVGESMATIFAAPQGGDDVKGLVLTAVEEFNEIMGIKEQPHFIHRHHWGEAFPHFGTGHCDILNTLTDYQKQNKGLLLSGSYISGAAVRQCINHAKDVAESFALDQE